MILLITSIFAMLCQSMVTSPARIDTMLTRFDLHATYLSPEKLYLHLDRTAFCPGETIWFNAYLEDASRNSLVPTSNFVYVELLKEDGSLERRVKLKRDGAGFPGHIDLKEDIAGGKYTIRAYTSWQLDSPAEYMFHQQIRIIDNGKSGRKERHRTESQDVIDVSFYPESGRYFYDVPSRIGFKAMDQEGRSLELKGKIVDQNGEEIIDVNTVHDGMGMIQFLPHEGNTYSLNLPSGERFPLPAPSEEGATMTVLGRSGKTYVRVFSPGEESYSLLLRDISQLRHVAEIKPGGQMKMVVINDGDISYGINHLLLTDSRGAMVAERLFFKYDDSNIRSCSISGPDSTPETHEAVTASLTLEDAAGAALDGTCSISIIGGSLSSNTQDDGIVSYMSLSSELRGTLNDPGYYFDRKVDFKDRSIAMDMLMMIQGWSYYDLDVISDPALPLDTHKHTREYVQTVKGKVSRTLSSKVPRKFLMAVLIPQLGAVSILPVEEGHRFTLDSLDLQEGTGILIKIKREGSDIIGYVPSWDGEEFADAMKYRPASGYSDVIPPEPVVNYEIPADTIKAAVLIEDKVPDDLGISGRTLPKQDIQIYGSMTIIDYLRMAAPTFYYKDGKMQSWRTAGLGGTASSDSWNDSPVQLVVDGSIAPWEPYETMLVGECESISISKDPSVVYRASDGVVAIRIQYGASNLRTVQDQPSTLYITPLGYQSPREFYSPRYDKGDAWDSSDKRNTVYWNPSVKLSGGHAEVTFCIPDEKDYPYFVRVEGVCEDGTPFSATGTLLKP